MSKKGKTVHYTERNILLKLMTFFEEEKKKKASIKPINRDVALMKIKCRKKKSSEQAAEPTEIEMKLLENEKQYQSLLQCFDNVARRAAAATGVSERTLRRVKQEARQIQASAGGSSSREPTQEIPIFTPRKSKPPKKRLQIDNFMICSIRNIIEQHYTVKKEVPTLRKILAVAQQEFQFPGQRVTLWKIITRQLGYRFKKYKHITYLFQKPEIAAWRARYLRKLRENDQLGAGAKPVVYVDEKQILNTTNSKRKLHSGYNSVVVLAGGESGFVDGANLLYKAESSPGDYHKAMDTFIFTKYLREKLVPNLPPECILVLDNAPYHNKQTNKPPTSEAQKKVMLKWLQENKISYDQGMTKRELYHLICQSKPNKQYEIDEILESHGHQVLRLPPYQCDLNPVEYIWRMVTRRVAESNGTLSDEELENLTLEAMEGVSADDWQEQVARVDRLRHDYWKRGRLQETIENELIISAGAESESGED